MREILVGYKEKIDEAEELLENNGIYTHSEKLTEALNTRPQDVLYPLGSVPIDYRLSVIYDQQYDDATKLLKNPNHEVQVTISEKEHRQIKRKTFDTATQYLLIAFAVVCILSLLVYKFV